MQSAIPLLLAMAWSAQLQAGAATNAASHPGHGRPSAPVRPTASARQAAKAALPYEVGEPARWVAVVPVADIPQGSGDVQGRGNDVLLVDRQIRLDASSEEYIRIVARVVNASGVASASQLRIGFDPERSSLRIHAVTIRRQEQQIDALKSGKQEILQRESALESGLLDGQLTFHLLLDDLRVGDVVDYSYTIDSRYPEWGNRGFGELSVQWNDPVARSRLRMVSKQGKALWLRTADGTTPVTSEAGGWAVNEWQWTPATALVADEDVPSHYETYPRVQYSQFSDWDDVRAAALPMYAADLPRSPEVDALLQRFRAAGEGAGERLVAALRFVQDEVRYTGIELGVRAFKPTNPAEVLRRRFGDCKDKTLLAVSLLRLLGIEADPALVSTHWNTLTGTRLPSPGAFNHAIVRVRLDGASHWYDVTSQAQGGDFDRFEESHPGEALVVAAGSSGLEAAPRQVLARAQVSSRAVFDLVKGSDQEADLRVSTTYRDSMADAMRFKLRSVRLEELQKNFLNYYRTRYPQIDVAEPISSTDDPAGNELVIQERYRIPQAFVAGENGVKHFAFEAELVNERLRAPRHTVRRLPLALDFPTWVEQVVEVRTPEGFNVQDEANQIETPQFRFGMRISHKDNGTTCEYQYRTLADEVSVNELPVFVKKREDARKATYFEFNLAAARAAKPADTGAALKELGAIGKLVKKGNFAAAGERLPAFMQTDGYRGLGSQQKRAALLMSGFLAEERNEHAKALVFLKGACAYSEADETDWGIRLAAASGSEDNADAALALTRLASRWPKSLADVKDAVFFKTLRKAPTAGTGRYELFLALQASGYAPDDSDLSWVWRELAALQIERGELEAARRTIGKITQPMVLVDVLADNRFSQVREEPGAALDVLASAERLVDQGRAKAANAMDTLEPTSEYCEALMRVGRYQQALDVLDARMLELRKRGGAKAYKDGEHRYVWLLDLRSRLLSRLGRLDEAVGQMEAASHMAETPGGNVSQVINLADLYTGIGRAKDARTALDGLKVENMTPFGKVQAEKVRLVAAIQLGDQDSAEAALKFVEAHQSDDPTGYVRSLLQAGRTDNAAREYIRQLSDPDLRRDALREAQAYDTRPSTPLDEELDRRWASLLQRPDVLAAIARIGRTTHFPLNETF